MNKHQFKVTGAIHITDPCYSIGTWCGAYNLKAKAGIWEGDLIEVDEGDWGKRVSTLVVHHTSHSPIGDWKLLDFDIGVDSGQAGVFDSSVYPTGETTGEHDDLNTFYGKACAETYRESNELNEKREQSGLFIQGGVVSEGGFVSSSGFGNGGYKAYGIYDTYVPDNPLIAVKIVFIGEDEDEEV